MTLTHILLLLLLLLLHRLHLHHCLLIHHSRRHLLCKLSRSILVVVYSEIGEIMIPKCLLRLSSLGQLRVARRFCTVGIGGGGNPPEGLHQAALRGRLHRSNPADLQQQRLSDDKSVLNHVWFLFRSQVVRLVMVSPVPVIPQLVTCCDQLLARGVLYLHHVGFFDDCEFSQILSVKEDSQGPFHQEAPLAP